MVRLSTPQIYNNGTSGLLRIQYDLYRIQNQMNTGRRVVTPADDPVAAAQALVTEQQRSVNAQFLNNQATATSQLAEIETQMQSMGDLITYLRSTLWVQAGNGSLGPQELEAIATDVKGRFEQMLGLANSSDASGVFWYSGFQGGTQPFVNNGGAVTYQGDNGNRQLQVSSGRFMNVSFSGHQMFEAIPQGNGTFVTGAASGNTGNGVITNGTVVGNFSGQTYNLVFDTPNSYTVNGGPSIPYTPGDDINLGGASFSISGSPAIGDQFTVAPSQNESIFTTLDSFINTLLAGNGNPGTPAERAAFQNSMARIGASLDQGLQHFLNNRTIIGAQLGELESLTAIGQDLNVQYETQISQLIDLDYASAATELSRRMLQLQAAQQSFTQITSLSLFNFI